MGSGLAGLSTAVELLDQVGAGLGIRAARAGAWLQAGPSFGLLLERPAAPALACWARCSPRRAEVGAARVRLCIGACRRRARVLLCRPQGYEVDIYEARPFIGGKVASYRDKDGNDIEMGLHVFFGAPPPTPHGCRGLRLGRRPAGPACAARGCSRRAGGRLRHPSPRPPVRRRRRRRPPPAGCYFNLFRLMAKCGVLENLLLKEHTHTFCNKVGRGGSGRARAAPGLGGRALCLRSEPAGDVHASRRAAAPPARAAHLPRTRPQPHRVPLSLWTPQGGDVRELDFRFFLGGTKIGAPFHGLRAFFTTPQVRGGGRRGQRAAVARAPLW